MLEKLQNKVVVMGGNSYTSLSALRCLGMHQVPMVVADRNNEGYSLKSKYCKEVFITPDYSIDQKAFVDALVDYAKQQPETPVLFPTNDTFIKIIDANFDILNKHFALPPIAKGLYTKVVDKNTLFELAQDKPINTPKTINYDPSKKLLLLEAVAEDIGFPCVVKPLQSPRFIEKFGKKLFVAENKDQLADALKLVEQENFIVIIQQMIPGFDDCMHTYDAYVDCTGKVTHWVTCQKVRQFPINYGASVYTKHKLVPELHEMGAPFLEAINFRGFAEIEFKRDPRTGKYYMIEINARITNINSLLLKSGVNFPYLQYLDVLGQPLPEQKPDYSTNTHFWYFRDDLRAIIGYMRTKQLSFKSIVVSLLGKPKAPAIWDIRDPKPMLAFLFLKQTRKLFNLIRRKLSGLFGNKPTNRTHPLNSVF